MCQLKIKPIYCCYSTLHVLYTITYLPLTQCITFVCSLHFRKMQEGDVGASNSDLQTDRADDDVTHKPARCVQKMAPCFQQETEARSWAKGRLKLSHKFSSLLLILINPAQFPPSFFCFGLFCLFALASFHFAGVLMLLSLFLFLWIVLNDLHVCRKPGRMG